VSASVLPRSLDPLPEESLIGFLLRLSHRLDIAPGELAVVCGLEPTTRLATSRLITLDAGGAFAGATGLSPAEADALTLTPLAARFPSAGLEFCGRTRTPGGMFVKESWVFSAATRYCPACLAGDGSPIQDAHGGPWKRIWRLPVVFGCVEHRSLLMATCPACGQPVHAKTESFGLLPAPRIAGLHPAACRNAVGTAKTPCGQRLDQVTPIPLKSRQLAFQQRLDRMLDPGTDTATSSADTTRYFNDLRIYSCLIGLSWPAVEPLVGSDTARLISEHVDGVREIIDSIRSGGRVVHDLEHYDRPPLDPATGAALLEVADRLAAHDEQRQETLRIMIAAVPRSCDLKQWLRLYRQGHCSLQLAAALTAVLNPPKALTPPPRPVSFNTDHIPTLVPADWLPAGPVTRTGIRPIIIARTAAVRLAQIVLGGGIERAASAIGTTLSTASAAIHEAAQHPDAERQALDDAIEAIAARLHTAGGHQLTGYGHRRRALADWTITPEEWDDLTADLQDADTHRDNPDRPTDWADLKRLSASAWVWARVTGGEQRLAPAFHPAPMRTAPTSLVGATKSPRYHLDRRDYGHYAALRHRLATYADDLANDIDANAGR
jgi:TniQ protein